MLDGKCTIVHLGGAWPLGRVKSATVADFTRRRATFIALWAPESKVTGGDGFWCKAKLRHLWPGASPDVGLTPVPGIGQARLWAAPLCRLPPEYAPWFGASAPVAAHRWPLGSLQRLL